MGLPQIKHPTFDIELPSTKEKIRVRPMLVRDEKILLTAQEGDAPREIYLAIRDVVQNCILGTEVKVERFTTFDLDYMFLKLRSVSVGDVVELVFTDSADDNKQHAFKIDLNKVVIKFPDRKKTINLTDTTVMEMRYPLASVYQSPAFESMDATDDSLFDELVASCLDKYYEGETAYSFKDVIPADLKKFIDDLDIKTYSKIRDFVTDLPTLYYKIDYKNSKDEDKSVEMTSLMDFFALA